MHRRVAAAKIHGYATIEALTTLSRVADSLYWVSRYLECAKNVARQLDVHLNIMVDLPPGAVEQQRLAQLQGSLSRESKQASSEAVLHELTFDAALPASLLAAITAAREKARTCFRALQTQP